MTCLPSTFRRPRTLLLLGCAAAGAVIVMSGRSVPAPMAAVAPGISPEIHRRESLPPDAGPARSQEAEEEAVAGRTQARVTTFAAHAPSHARIRQPASLPSRHPAPASRHGQETSTLLSASSDAGRIFELAPGMLAPAAVAATHEALPLTPEQETLKEKIAGDFAREIERSLADPAVTPGALGETWNAAQKRADERFRLMFGDAAFVKQTAAAAREAAAAP